MSVADIKNLGLVSCHKYGYAGLLICLMDLFHI